MHVALHRHSLRLTSSLLLYPEKAVIYVRKVHIHHALVVVAAHLAGEALELHRGVVQIDRLSALLLPLADLLDDERQAGRAGQQNMLHVQRKRRANVEDGTAGASCEFLRAIERFYALETEKEKIKDEPCVMVVPSGQRNTQTGRGWCSNCSRNRVKFFWSDFQSRSKRHMLSSWTMGPNAGTLLEHEGIGETIRNAALHDGGEVVLSIEHLQEVAHKQPIQLRLVVLDVDTSIERCLFNHIHISCQNDFEIRNEETNEAEVGSLRDS